MIRFISFIAFFFFFHGLVAQNKGQVMFLVDVDNGYFEIEINDTMLLKRYKTDLPEGHYKAKIWSPGYVVNTIEFDITANKTTEKYVKMERTNDFIQYEYDYKQYRQAFHKSFTLPGALALTSAVYTGTTMLRMYNFRQRTLDEIELYNLSSTSNEIEQIKLNVNNYNRKFLNNRTYFYTGIGFTALFTGYTIYAYSKFKKNHTEPTFNKDSPFRDKYSFYPGMNSLTLQIKIG